MSLLSIALSLLFAIVVIYIYCTNKKEKIIPSSFVISDVDGSEYKVVGIYENKREAANILAKLNLMYVKLIKHLKRNKMGTIWAENIIYLSDNYNPDVLQEHIPSDLNLTSYVSNKGEKIILCLRRVENRNEFYGENTIKFVAIHELAHMMTHSYGHENDFWEAFEFLLGEAEKLGVIKIIDYSKFPEPYCGIMITSNPIFEVI